MNVGQYMEIYAKGIRDYLTNTAEILIRDSYRKGSDCVCVMMRLGFRLRRGETNDHGQTSGLTTARDMNTHCSSGMNKK